jgi:hypothetical protein
MSAEVPARAPGSTPFKTVQLVFPPQVNINVDANARYAIFCNHEVSDV